jgi:hypothetical protein
MNQADMDLVAAVEAHLSAKDKRVAELERVLKIARDHVMERGKGSTHWEGCDSAHPDCAIIGCINKALGL